MRVRLKHRVLARLIAESRLSQNRWAQKMGLSSGHLSLLANGQRPYPSPNTRRKLLEAFRCGFGELFEIEVPAAPNGWSLDPADKEREVWILNFWQDLRWSFRLLLQHKSFTAVALIALALGIGANAALFSVTEAVLLRPLPFSEPSRVVAFWDAASWSKAEIQLMQKAAASSFSGISGYGLRSVTLTGRPEPVLLSGVTSSGNLFQLLGVEAARGETFGPQHNSPGSHRVAVFSHGLWERLFGADPNVVGGVVEIGEESFQVLGVMPPNFFFPIRGIEIWLPLEMDEKSSAFRHGHAWDLVGRLASGVSLEQAHSALDGIGQVMREEFNYPPQFDKFAAPPPLTPLHQHNNRNVRPALLLLLGAVGLVLVIACANVANMLLARINARRRELGMRSALGADGRRILSQLLTESLVLALLGGAAGTVLAAWAIRFAQSLFPQEILNGHPIALNWTVLLFALAVSLATGALFGALPALEAMRTDVRDLIGGGRTPHQGFSGKLGGILVSGEIALCVVLLAGAGLTLQSLMGLYNIDPGFEPDRLTTFKTYPMNQRFNDRAGRVRFYEQALESLRALPGVERVGAVQNLPIEYAGWNQRLEVEGRSGDYSVYWRIVAGDYLETLGVQLREGRYFGTEDGPDAPGVCIVNESFQRRYWPGGSALGNRIRVSTDGRQWLTVVGVVSDVKFRGLGADAEPLVYRPYAQNPFSSMLSFVVRSSLEPSDLSRVVSQAVWRIDSNAPVFDQKTFRQIVSESIGPQRLLTFLLVLLGAVALFLGGVGVYGLISYRVSRRRYEFGVRMALGARRRDVIRLVLRQSLVLVSVGLAVGVAGALLAGRLLAAFLFGVGAADAATIAAVALVIAATAMAATYFPARRATQVDPNQALRAE